MTRPLPLFVPINARPPSDRLPLAFRRPLGGKPAVGSHAPSVPGRIPVAKSWGFAAYEAADAAACAMQSQAAAGVLLDWAHLPKGDRCRRLALPLHACRTNRRRPSENLYPSPPQRNGRRWHMPSRVHRPRRRHPYLPPRRKRNGQSPAVRILPAADTRTAARRPQNLHLRTAPESRQDAPALQA